MSDINHLCSPEHVNARVLQHLIEHFHTNGRLEAQCRHITSAGVVCAAVCLPNLVAELIVSSCPAADLDELVFVKRRHAACSRLPANPVGLLRYAGSQ